MKKIFVLTFVFLNLISFASAINSEYNPNRPEWNEFCPFGLENAEFKKTKWYQYYLTKLNTKEQNYWYLRRKDFEKSLQFCDNVQKEKQNACYQKIKERQINLNNSHITAYEEHAIKQAQWNQVGDFMTQERRFNESMNLKRQQVDIQRLQVLNENRPKTYNVNIDHKIRY